MHGSEEKFDFKKRGEYHLKENIKFENVPIISPNGDVLIDSINFEVKPGMNLFIQGPNGCGKSSLFRILGGLWPLFDGHLDKPDKEEIFYIPQRPYTPAGTLRDQIIYPHDKYKMLKKGYNNDKLNELLKVAQLDYLVEREGGFDVVQDWGAKLAGGEKQKIAMARLFYHQPKYAILDECTSAVSIDLESILYTHSKELGITLITVSHRPTLLKFHEYLLKMDGKGGWTFEKLEHESK